MATIVIVDSDDIVSKKNLVQIKSFRSTKNVNHNTHLNHGL